MTQPTPAGGGCACGRSAGRSRSRRTGALYCSASRRGGLPRAQGAARRPGPRREDCKLTTAEGVAVGHAKSRGMTTEHDASRTRVKSPPELWAECSEAASLARHLGEFGEIKITRLEPETAVAWEGERASGTVRIEPSGWGTRVTLKAQLEVEAAAEPEPVAEPEPELEPVAERPEPVAEPEPLAEPVAETEPEPQPERLGGSVLLARAGFFARIRTRLRPQAAVRPVAPAREPEPEPEPE